MTMQKEAHPRDRPHDRPPQETATAHHLSRGRALLLALLPLAVLPVPPALATGIGAPPAATLVAAGHAEGDPGPTVVRIPSERGCWPVRGLALGGDAAAHYRWALRYVDRQDDPVSGRCLGPAGRRIALQRLQNVIVARGYVTTRVVLADIQGRGAMLAFTVVPGRVGQVQFRPDIPQGKALREVVPLRRGALLNLRAIEQALTELTAAPAMQADIRILPAAGNASPRSESDLLIVWQPSWRAPLPAAGSTGVAGHPRARYFGQRTATRRAGAAGLTLP